MSNLSSLEVRILVLAPRGRDANLIAGTLSEGGMSPVVCVDEVALAVGLTEGAAAIIVAEEALTPQGVETITRWLEVQEPWSDLPIAILTHSGRASVASVQRAKYLEVLGNITFLERPARPDTVRSSMRAALRARMRQYEMRRRQEMLVRVNGDLERFAYSASHDLQEPIRHIAIYSEILSLRYGALLDETGLGYLANVREGANRMQALVRDLLAYTQAASIADDVADPCDATAAFDAASQILLDSVPPGSSITRSPFPQVKIAAIHLQQMFQNLISNAIKYRGPEPLRVHVSAESKDGFCKFGVADNGIGISAQYKDLIFGVFKRLHTQEKYPGTGIGLAICQRIAERYGGRIWVESEVGKGSTFFFTVPA